MARWGAGVGRWPPLCISLTARTWGFATGCRMPQRGPCAQQWEKEGRIDDLLRLYDNPYHRPAPTKIPAGRIALTLPAGAAFERAELGARNPAAIVRFRGGAARVWIHATEPVGFIRLTGLKPEAIALEAPAFGGQEPGEAKPAISAGDLAQLGYGPPETRSGDGWRAWIQEGWGGFTFAVYLGWRERDGVEGAGYCDGL